MIVGEIRNERPPQRGFVENDHVVQTLAPNRADQIARDLIERKRLAKLLRGPFRRGMRGRIEVHNASPLVRQHEKHVEHVEVDTGHGERVDGDEPVVLRRISAQELVLVR